MLKNLTSKHIYELPDFLPDFGCNLSRNTEPQYQKFTPEFTNSKR